MKIVVADTLPASALELLKADGWTVDARSGRAPDALANDLADADALLVRGATKVDARLLAAAPRLRIVARAGTGVDNVDVEAASSRGILVVNAAGANSISVAEHAWALMLALARAIPSADRAMKEGRWEKKAFLGTELRGKTLGVAGFGRIGQEVAQRGSGVRDACHRPRPVHLSRPGGTLRRRAGVDRRTVRRVRLPDVAPAGDRRHAPFVRRQAFRAVQTRDTAD